MSSSVGRKNQGTRAEDARRRERAVARGNPRRGDFGIDIVPAGGTSAADYSNGNFGTFPLCEQLSSKLEELACVAQRTQPAANKPAVIPGNSVPAAATG
jgi:hypothetical protein